MLTYHSPVYFQVHDLETTPLWPLIPQPPRSSSWPSVAQALSTQTHLNVCLMKTSCMKTLQEQDSTSETKVLHKTIIIYHRIFLLIGWIQKQPIIGQTEACLNTSIYTVSFQPKPDIEGGALKIFLVSIISLWLLLLHTNNHKKFQLNHTIPVRVNEILALLFFTNRNYSEFIYGKKSSINVLNLYSQFSRWYWVIKGQGSVQSEWHHGKKSRVRASISMIHGLI